MTDATAARPTGVETELRQTHPLPKFSLSDASPATLRTPLLVAGVYSDGTLTAAAQTLDAASRGRLSAVLKRGDLEPGVGSTLLLYDVPGASAQRVLLVNLGAPRDFHEHSFFKALYGAGKALGRIRADEGSIALVDVEVSGRPLAWRIMHAARILADAGYRFDAPKQAKDDGTQRSRGARSLTLLLSSKATPGLETAMRRGAAVAAGMALTRDLGNLPGNVCNPEYLAETARALGRTYGFEVEILEREDMAKLGMFSALSVGRASDHPCKFIVVKHEGGGGRAPIVLIGKGVTFDTGGVSLKPGDDLDMMKYDMCGAAGVLGAMDIVGRLELPLDVVGIVGAVENMPGGNATRPGDVVRSMSGQTIEILNTDAEGRLVLCDALTYAERFEPECVIDIATLTGACVIALGTQTSGLYANDESLGEELFQCGMDTGDRAWRMPLWDEYQEQLRSNFADMSNLGGRPAGSVTAACFLARFAGNYPWAHLDIAGTASAGGDAKGATGRPVPLISEFLLRRADRSPARS